MNCVGVDIIEISRIETAVQQWGTRFLHRVFTESELEICRVNPSALAVRFAGKEAVMKVLGTGTTGISWKEIEILPEPSGKPFVNLYGKAKDKARSLGLDEVAISLSHSREYAIAFAAGETIKA